MFFEVGRFVGRRRARTRRGSCACACACGSTSLPHIARGSRGSDRSFDGGQNEALTRNITFSDPVEWSEGMLKCRDNYLRDRRNTKKNVPEVVKKSVCSRDGLPTARPWPPRREQPTCEKLPLNNSCCYVRRAACFSPLTPRQSLDSLPRPPLFFSPLARTASLH